MTMMTQSRLNLIGKIVRKSKQKTIRKIAKRLNDFSPLELIFLTKLLGVR